MSSEVDQTAMRRKASARQSTTEPTVMDIPKAMRFAMAKAGDVVLQATVGVRDVSEDALLPDTVDEGLPESPLLMQIEDEAGYIGIAVACGQTIGAVIEASTMGTILPGEAGARKPTRTDAALVTVFLDKFLADFGVLAQTCMGRPPVDGFSVKGTLPDTHAAKLILADDTLRRYKITVDFGLGAKVGTLMLLFPFKRKATPNAVKSADEWSASLEKAVLGTSARLTAVLCTLKVPLSHISGLSVGDLLPLDDVDLDGLVMVGTNGKQVLRARLGRSGPLRAVRLLNGNDSADASQSLESLALQAQQDMGGGEPLALPNTMAEPPSLPMASQDLGEMEPAMDFPAMGNDILGAIDPIQVPEDEAIQG